MNKSILILLVFLFVILLAFSSIMIEKYSINMIQNGDSVGRTEGLDNNLYDGTNSNENNDLPQSGEEKREEEDANMGVIELKGEDFENEVLNSEKTVLIDFYADWCMPCKMMAPVVEKVASENADIKVVKINIDNEQDIAIQYGIMSIPTFMVVKNGEVVNRIVGVVDKAELESAIK